MIKEIRPGLLYHALGRVEEVFPRNGKEFTLKELQEFVGGYIEYVPGSRPAAFCNEEGRLQNLPVNRSASIAFKQVLVGNVIQTNRPLERTKR